MVNLEKRKYEIGVVKDLQLKLKEMGIETEFYDSIGEGNDTPFLQCTVNDYPLFSVGFWDGNGYYEYELDCMGYFEGVKSFPLNDPHFPNQLECLLEQISIVYNDFISCNP
jgi:hypothetical protein